MNISDALDVAIGMILVYLILSLLCSAINEIIARWFSLRAKTLEQGLITMLKDPDLVQQLYAHPLIDTQHKKGWLDNLPWVTGKPSYISAETFALTLINVLETQPGAAPSTSAPAPTGTTGVATSPPGSSGAASSGAEPPGAKSSAADASGATPLSPGAPGTTAPSPGASEATDLADTQSSSTPTAAAALQADRLVQAIVQLADPASAPKKETIKPNWHLQQVLQLLLQDAEGDYVKMRAAIEQWYDDTMDRVSGWYKRQVHLILLCIALVITAGIGVDSLTIANSLWQNSALRAAVVSAAEKDVNKLNPNSTNPNPLPGQIKTLQSDLSQLNLPLGYSSDPTDPRFIKNDFGAWIFKIIGLLITTIALSFGAPFWFDLLNNFVNLRQTGPPPGTAASTTPQSSPPATK